MRPRSRSGVESWSVAFAFDVHSVKARPATKRSGAAAASVDCGASGELRDAEGRRASEQKPRARARDGGGDERADERARRRSTP